MNRGGRKVVLGFSGLETERTDTDVPCQKGFKTGEY